MSLSLLRGIGGRLSGGFRAAATVVLVVAVAAGMTAVPASGASAPTVALGVVQGAFYANPHDSGSFDTSQVGHAVFHEQFSRIAFDPPSAQQVSCPNNLPVNDSTRPFTDLESLSSGNCIGNPAAGNGVRAGAGTLASFEASFLSTLHVAKPGDVTFELYSDDGWILSLGAAGGSQPTYVHGALANPPASSPVKHYRVVGADNQPNSPTAETVTVQFPAAGDYPLELDYTECCGGELTFVFGTSSETPIPGTGIAGLRGSSLLGGGNPSSNAPCLCSGDPVETATGNFTETTTDLTLAGRGPAVTWDRTYNSQDTARSGPLGVGWSSPYTMRLAVDADTGQATVVQENGATVEFAPTNSGYQAPAWVLAALTHNGDGTWTFVRRSRMVFTFDPQGYLTAISDLNGEVTHLAYDSKGGLASVIDPDGRVVTVTTDGAGHITSITDPMGRLIRYSYDDADDLINVTDAAGRVTRYIYDATHHLQSMTDPTGATTANTYDDAGRVVTQTNPDGAITSYAYTDDDPTQTSTTITDPTGLVTTQAFVDDLPRSVTIGAPTGAPAMWTYTTDPFTFGISSITDPDGRTTTTSYDVRGNIAATTLPSGATMTATYDGLNDPISTTDALGATTTFAYDGRGNETSMTVPTDAGQSTTTFSHGDPDHPGDVTAITEPNGHTTTLRYTVAGLVASATSPLGRVTSYAYDADGELTSRVLPSGATTTQAYDSLGNPTVATDALGHRATSAYDADSRLVSVTDAAGRVTRYVYDPTGRLVTTVRPDGTDVHDRFDAAGRLTSQTDAAGHVIRYAYDALGRLATRALPTGAVTTYTHDAAGQLVSSEDGLGRTTSYGHTPDGYLADIDYSDPHTADVHYTYDAGGRRTTMTDGTGTTSYQYGPAGEMLSVTNGAGATVAYRYDLAGQLTQLTYPDGTRSVRSYSADGNETSLTDGRGGAFHFSYTADGAPATQTAPNGTITRYRYDELDQLIGINIARGKSPLLSMAYRRNAVGLPVSLKSTGAGNIGPEQYGYNPLDQLSSIARSGATDQGALRYQYDKSGDLTSVTGPGSNTSALGYTAAGVLASMTTGAGRRVNTVEFGYDSLGDRTTATMGDATFSYGYNQAGALATYAGPTGGLPISVDKPSDARPRPKPQARASYTYDGDQTRVSKTVNGRTTAFVYDPTTEVPQLVAAAGGTTAPGKNCATGPAKPRRPKHGNEKIECSALITETDYLYDPAGNPIEQITTNGQHLYLHTDQLGSVRLVSDSRGHPVARYDYTAYGTLRQQGSGGRAPVTNLLYTGAYLDPESGLYYLHARYYDPATAQFITRDPLYAATLNGYSYAADSPIDNVDPSGLCPRYVRDESNGIADANTYNSWHTILLKYIDKALDIQNKAYRYIDGKSCAWVIFCHRRYPDKATRDGLKDLVHQWVLQGAAQLGLAYWDPYSTDDIGGGADKYAHYYQLWVTSGGKIAVDMGEYGTVAGVYGGINGLVNKLLGSLLKAGLSG